MQAVQDKVLITLQSAFLCLTRAGPWGHASIWPGLLCRGVSVCSRCRPKFLLNASGGRNGEGLEGGGGGGGMGGGGGTAAPPAAAVQKPCKNINLSKRSL